MKRMWSFLIAACLALIACRATPPRIYIYELPKELETKFVRSVFGSDRHLAMLRTIKTICTNESDICHWTKDGNLADYFWVPGLGSVVLDWVRAHHPWWNETRSTGQARHLMMTTHDLGAAEMYWRLDQGHAGKGTIDPEYDPISVNRTICYLQYHGLMDGGGSRMGCGVCFQQGKDIMLMKGEGVCGPMCGFSLEDLRNTSVWGSRGKWSGNSTGASDIDKRRDRLLYFTGSAGKIPVKEDGTGRGSLYHFYHNDSRVRVAINGIYPRRVKNHEEMLSSDFCYSPLGVRQGCTDRYIPSVLMGCVPVLMNSTCPGNNCRISFGHALPLEEVIDWSKFSTLADEYQLDKLAEQLECLTPRLKEMRMEMGKVWEQVLWTKTSLSHVRPGPYLGESGANDFFNTLMRVLASRIPQGYKPTDETIKRMQHRNWPCRSEALPSISWI